MSGLSGQDAAFLAFEGPGRPMHVAVLATFVRRTPSDAARLRGELARRLAANPRLAQRLDPGRGGPRWCDAPDFDPAAHIRVLPRALHASSAAWSRTLDRLLARPLEPGRPLWEAWILPDVDGGDRFTLVLKAHHCMLDGASGVALLQNVFDPLEGLPSAPPRPVPRTTPRRSGRRSGGIGALLRLLTRTLRPTTATPLNGARHGAPRYAHLSLDEAALRDVARSYGASMNDALLAVVAGGLRDWLTGCGTPPEALRLRALCPVSVRARGDTDLGNRLGAWLIDLPTTEPDAGSRLEALRRTTAAARRTGLGRGVELLARFSDFLPAWFPALGMRLAGRLRLFNVVVTQPPAVPVPLAFLGNRLESLHPFAPTFAGQRCSVAAIRYGGRLHLGVTGAWARRLETEELGAALHRAYLELCPPADGAADSRTRAAS